MSLGFLLSPYLAFLRNSFRLLAGMTVIRILIGAVGVPPAIGSWITSLTLLAMIVAIYYGYSAPSKGLNKWWQVIVIGLLISVVFNLLVISGILISANLMIPNYFNGDAQSMSLDQHMGAHLLGALVETIPLSLLAGIGFALGRRKPVLKSQPAV